MISSIAYAMGPGGAGGQGAQGGFSAFIPLILMFVIFYFLLIRPQQKKAKEHQEMINNLKRGDKIITGGGIHASVTNIDDQVLTVEIADKVRVKMNRASVAALVKAGPQSQNEKKEKADPNALKQK